MGGTGDRVFVDPGTGRKKARDKIEAYRKAIESKMRFYSYGDAMLIL